LSRASWSNAAAVDGPSSSYDRAITRLYLPVISLGDKHEAAAAGTRLTAGRRWFIHMS
jgi:hypothetical protein